MKKPKKPAPTKKRSFVILEPTPEVRTRVERFAQEFDSTFYKTTPLASEEERGEQIKSTVKKLLQKSSL